MPKISIISPVYNEEDSLPLFSERLQSVLDAQGYDYEVILVNDGSSDNSARLIEQWISRNPKISLIELSRNFGHQQAISAGLKEAAGDAVIIMDADLQDPPEIIPDLVREWKSGAKIVLAEREQRDEGFARKCLFQWFYKIFALLSDMDAFVTSGVFGLMDRDVTDQLNLMEERNRYLPGLRGWVGFKTSKIYYKRQDRAAGKPKQSLGKLFSYGMDAIFSFSYKPLRISFLLGCLISTASFAYGAVLVIQRLLSINVVRGFTTPTVTILFLGGLILISNGILGEYLARVYEEVKRRPFYIISKKINR